jgi:hypothetical protein
MHFSEQLLLAISQQQMVFRQLLGMPYGQLLVPHGFFNGLIFRKACSDFIVYPQMIDHVEQLFTLGSVASS